MNPGIHLSHRRRLPHLRLAGATYFVTWRLRRRQPDLSPDERTIVLRAIRHFDGDRYTVAAAVVMNDHVHVLLVPGPSHRLEVILHSFKSFTSHRLVALGRTGRVWVEESFDRIVRDDVEMRNAAAYIAANPAKRWPGVTAYPWVYVRENSG